MHGIIVRLFAALALIITGSGAVAAAPPAPTDALVVVQLADTLALERVETSGMPIYAHFSTSHGPRLLAGALGGDTSAFDAARLRYEVIDTIIAGAAYYLAYPMPLGIVRNWSAYGQPLLVDERVVVLRTSTAAAERLANTGVRVVPVTLTSKPLRSAAVAAFPQVTTPDPAVQDMVAQVDQARIYQYTGDLSGERLVAIRDELYTISTRHTNSNKPIQEATRYVGDHMDALGLAVEYHRWGPETAPNVIGELTGESQPDNVFMITAHLDDMPSGSIAPGADDNASGSVAVMVASDIIGQHRWSCTLRFAFWTGEEQGLLGSAKYAQRARSQNEDILGVLNLDMIAWNTAGSAPGIDLHANSTMPPTVELANQFASVVDVYGVNLIPEVRPDGTGSSDHASFWTQGYTAILGIEDYYPSNHDFNPYYHTVNDRLDKLDMTYYTEFVKASVAEMAHMAGCRIAGPAAAADYNSNDVRVQWPSSAADAAYEVHRSTEPYFTPTTDTRLTTVNPPYGDPESYTDRTSGAGDPLINHFYVVRAMNADGRGAVSNRTGEFDFSLTTGG